MKRLWIALAALLVMAGVWLGNTLNFSLGLFGVGTSTAPPAASEESLPEPAGEGPKEDSGPIVDGVLKVRIDGDQILMEDKPTTIDAIAELAAKHDAKVVVERSPSAERRPREELERGLRERNIHVVLE